MTKNSPMARRSQLVSTYGVGGLFPSENASYMIVGLQAWDTKNAEPTSEPRLARSLGVSYLRMPPASGRNDVPVVRFPQMQICPQCRRIGTIRDFGCDWNKAICKLCSKIGEPLSPSRLVIACPAGHIDDFPYFAWAHAGANADRGGEHKLSLRTRGRTSSLADMVVECSCGVAPVGLDGSFDAGALKGLIRCHGRRPWLGAGSNEDCAETPRTLQRGASNVWFPAVRSAISIPPFSEALAKFVDRHWMLLQDPADVTPKQLERLVDREHGRFRAEDILREATRRHDAETNETDVDEASLRHDEYRALLDGRPEDDGSSDFVCLPMVVPGALDGFVDQVRKVTRLREVRALYGFSRLSAATGPTDPHLSPLSSEELDWLPAIEVIGEGVFIGLDRGRVSDWADTDFAQRRRALLQNAANRAAEAADRDQAATIDISMVMIHTLAHVLIDQFALDAGYPAASIRERLFVDNEMSGVLLYTATSDSAGSLGGLAAQADVERLDAAVTEGLRRLAWCSSDPVCIESSGSGADGLNLAACHSCVLIPETSCEERNVLLDRATLFGEPSQPDAGYFSALVGSPR